MIMDIRYHDLISIMLHKESFMFWTNKIITYPEIQEILLYFA